MVLPNVQPCRLFRAIRFIASLFAGWILASLGAWAQQPPCNGCAPDSQPHALSACYMTTATTPYWIYDTNPQSAVNLACQEITVTYQVVIVSPCTLGNPPVPYSWSSGTQTTFRFWATFFHPQKEETYTGSFNAPQCVCRDSLNPRNVGVGTDGFCHCKYGLHWDAQLRACVETPVTIGLFGGGETPPVGTRDSMPLPVVAKVTRGGTPNRGAR